MSVACASCGMAVAASSGCDREPRGADGAPESEHEVAAFFVGESPTLPELLQTYTWGQAKDEVGLPVFKPDWTGKLVRDYGDRLHLAATYRDGTLGGLHARLDGEGPEIVDMAVAQWGPPLWVREREVDIATEDDETETEILTDHWWYAPESQLRVRITGREVHFEPYLPIDQLIGPNGFSFEGDGIIAARRDDVVAQLGLPELQTTKPLLPSEFTAAGGLVRVALDFSADASPVLETFTVKIDVGLEPDVGRDTIQEALDAAFGKNANGLYRTGSRQVMLRQPTRDTVQLVVSDFVDLASVLPDEIGLFGPFSELRWGMTREEITAIDEGLIGRGGTERIGLRGVRFSVGIDDARGLDTVRLWAGVSQLGDAIGSRWGLPASAPNPENPSAPERFWFNPDAELRAHFEPDLSTTNSATLHIERYLPLEHLIRRTGSADGIMPERGDSRAHVQATYGIESKTGLGAAAWSLPLETDLDSVPPTGVLQYDGDRVVDVQVTVAMSDDRWQQLLESLGGDEPLAVTREAQPAGGGDTADGPLAIQRARAGGAALRYDPSLDRLTVSWR